METTISSKMKIGITILFKDNKDPLKINGILKSTVIELYGNNLKEAAQNIGNNIAEFYDFKYLGINDLFIVSGNPKAGELLGRTTYYEIDSLKEVKALLPDNYSLNRDSSSNLFNCSILYFCQNNDKDKFCISVLSIVKSSIENLPTEIETLAQSDTFLAKIKSTSIENIEEIEYIGIEDICDIDLKFNVFQSFYMDFEFEEELKEELLSDKEIKEILDDIVADW